jgi:magnesium transporter
MITTTDHLHQPIMTVARKDFATLFDGFSIQQALDNIRSNDIGEKIVYFYVVNDQGSMVGVVPTRRLLTSPLDQRLAEIMITQVVTIPDDATVLDACDFFAIHRLLAFPVVDKQRHIMGVVDVSVFTDEVFDLTERERMEEVFELIGFHISQVRDASPFRAFRFRFMWLLATIFSGTICAMLASAYEITLAKTLVLAFFLTMVLGLGESVSIQSMTVTIQALRSKHASLQWYVRALRREAITALLLGSGCGVMVSMIVWLWHGTGLPALAIGASVLVVLFGSCILGLSVPSLLHALKLDLKIAAGPVTLAFTDIYTILCYFSLAAILL